MAHGEIGVSAGFYIIVAVWAVVLMGSLAIGLDALTPRRHTKVAQYVERTGARREPLWLYIFPGLILAVLVGGSIVYSSMLLSAVVAVVAILNVAIIPAYLLRMVFPKQPICDDDADGIMAAEALDAAEADTPILDGTPADTTSPNEGA